MKTAHPGIRRNERIKNYAIISGSFRLSQAEA